MVLMKGAAKYEKEMDTTYFDIAGLGGNVLLLFTTYEYTQSRKLVVCTGDVVGGICDSFLGDCKIFDTRPKISQYSCF